MKTQIKRHKHILDNKYFGGKYNGFYSWYCKVCKRKFTDKEAGKILNKN